MDKIICDVCGTSYPEMSEQCPICGYAKPVAPVKSADSESSGGYRHVKGGRFSSANVRRRNEQRGVPIEPQEPDEDEQPVKKGSNMVLGIIFIILLLALIAVLLWFIIDIVGERLSMMETIPTQTTQQQTTLQLQPSVIELDSEGAVAIIQASVVPVDAEAFYLFSSENESIATVDEFGTVTAVAEGQTYITVSYGDLSEQVQVICEFTQPTETTVAADPIVLNRSDFTLNAAGEKWDLCGSGVTIAKNQITWTSDDESVAKIEGGVVEAIGPGVTKVHGQYEEFTATCVVRCKFEVESTDPTGSSAPDGLVTTKPCVCGIAAFWSARTASFPLMTLFLTLSVPMTLK